MEFEKIKVYGKKNLSDLLKEIHNNNQSKEEEIKKLILDLKGKIEHTGDAIMIVPLIAKYMEISIKNDDNLLKMVGIVQRAVQVAEKNNSNDFELTDEEKDKLLEQVNQLKAV